MPLSAAMRPIAPVAELPRTVTELRRPAAAVVATGASVRIRLTVSGVDATLTSAEVAASPAANWRR